EDEAVQAKLQAAERGDTSSWVSVTVDEGPTVRYNSNFLPNAIDPCVFYDKDERLWMLYGSFSGGIFVLELNQDGSLKEGQDYYGTKLMGNYHSRFEGPFMLYSPETDYYYMFLSFGGLSANQGYNIRVMRSKNPDGVFYDAAGNSMLDAMGIPGQTLNRQDKLIEKYGLKMMGNFVFQPYGDETNASEAYRSPGHNSAYYNPETGQYFLIFHTRFDGTGDRFQVRVHEMFMNEDDWLVAAPHRYTGEIKGNYNKEACTGTYKMVNHGTAITQDIVASEIIQLNDDNTVSGALNGTWSVSKEDERMLTMNLGGKAYKGVFYYQNDSANDVDKMTFSVCGSDSNVTIWGSKAD
ncbi:MAG TPA: glycoside hydrolase family 43 protein, partial [Draconibacterium sp.]|nr:glycoside hydrolase family 43 protein [Draconibacterium sp.]